MKCRIARAIVCLVIMTGIAHAESISGTYVAKETGSVSLVQMVETQNGQLSGRFERFVILADGKTTDVNMALNGVRDGETVVVTIKPPQFLSGSIPVSGTWRNDVLHLVGSGEGFNINLDLVKSDEAEFRTQVAVLTQQVQQLVQARYRASLVGRITALVRETAAFSTKADGSLGYFQPIEERYKSITNYMRRAFARQRSIYGGVQASVARIQIYAEINQANIQAEQIHNEIESRHRDFEAKATALIRSYGALSQECQFTKAETAISSDWKDAAEACRTMFDKVAKFQSSVGTTRAAFSRLEKTWHHEQNERQRILQASYASN